MIFVPYISILINYSCKYQLYRSFDEAFETRAIFQDISKAFDKVWDEGLSYKLQIAKVMLILQNKHNEM